MAGSFPGSRPCQAPNPIGLDHFRGLARGVAIALVRRRWRPFEGPGDRPGPLPPASCRATRLFSDTTYIAVAVEAEPVEVGRRVVGVQLGTSPLVFRLVWLGHTSLWPDLPENQASQGTGSVGQRFSFGSGRQIPPDPCLIPEPCGPVSRLSGPSFFLEHRRALLCERCIRKDCRHGDQRYQRET